MSSNQYNHYGQDSRQQGSANVHEMPTMVQPPHFPPMYPQSQFQFSHCQPAVELKDLDMWKDYAREGNEMLVVNEGRDLFPRIKYIVNNLVTYGLYIMGLKLQRLGDRTNSQYNNKENDSNEIYLDAKPGWMWMETGISFDKAKIYNVGNQKKKDSACKKPEDERKTKTRKMKTEADLVHMMKVISMEKYVPLLSIYQQMPNGGYSCVSQHQFPETTFQVVTKYRNKAINEMKKANNKYVTVSSKTVKQATLAPSSVTTQSTAPSSNHPSPLQSTSPTPFNPSILSINPPPPPDFMFVNLATVPYNNVHNSPYYL